MTETYGSSSRIQSVSQFVWLQLYRTSFAVREESAPCLGGLRRLAGATPATGLRALFLNHGSLASACDLQFRLPAVFDVALRRAPASDVQATGAYFSRSCS